MALSALPEAHGVAQGCVSIAIFNIDRGSVAEQVLYHFEVTLTGSNMQGGTAIIVTQAQITTLGRETKKTSVSYIETLKSFTSFRQGFLSVCYHRIQNRISELQYCFHCYPLKVMETQKGTYQ